MFHRTCDINTGEGSVWQLGFKLITVFSCNYFFIFIKPYTRYLILTVAPFTSGHVRTYFIQKIRENIRRGGGMLSFRQIAQLTIILLVD